MIIVTLINNIYINAYFMSFSFVATLTIIMLLLRLNGFNLFSLNIIFIFFSMIFIGGRFVSCLIDFFANYQNSYSVVNLFNQGRMIETNFTISEALYMYTFLTLWFSAFFLGSIILRGYYKNIILNHNKNKIIQVVFFISLLVLLILKGSDLYNVYQNGYLSLYIRSEEVVWKGSVIFLSSALFISSYAYLNINKLLIQKAKYVYLIGIIDLIIGKRGAFFSNILGAFSINSKVEKINFLKIILYILFIFFLLNMIMYFSFRENELDFDLSISESISALLFSQGTTLGVISYSVLDIQEVGLRLGIKSFIPFTNSFYTLFFDNIPYYERSIGQYISYQASSALYLTGGGLGSSIISEGYLIFGYFGSLIFAFLFGYFISNIEFKKNYKSIYRYLWIGSIFLMPTLPRSGISNYTITLIILIILYFIYNIKYKSKIKIRSEK
jgi:hypothetical protein